jgi:hypothetical protein
MKLGDMEGMQAVANSVAPALLFAGETEEATFALDDGRILIGTPKTLAIVTVKTGGSAEVLFRAWSDVRPGLTVRTNAVDVHFKPHIAVVGGRILIPDIGVDIERRENGEQARSFDDLFKLLVDKLNP